MSADRLAQQIARMAPVERELPEVRPFVLDVVNRWFSECPTPPSY